MSVDSHHTIHVSPCSVLWAFKVFKVFTAFVSCPLLCMFSNGVGTMYYGDGITAPYRVAVLISLNHCGWHHSNIPDLDDPLLTKQILLSESITYTCMHTYMSQILRPQTLSQMLRLHQVHLLPYSLVSYSLSKYRGIVYQLICLCCIHAEAIIGVIVGGTTAIIIAGLVSVSILIYYYKKNRQKNQSNLEKGSTGSGTLIIAT